MSNRETKTLTCPSGKEVVIKTRLNAREMQRIENSPFGAADFKLEQERNDDTGELGPEKPKLKRYDAAEGMILAENELFIQAIVSFDKNEKGEPLTDRILDRILDGRPADHKFIKAALDEITKNPDELK